MEKEDLRFLVYDDLNISSPELDCYFECPHFGDEKNNGFNNTASRCGLITRYYEDELYVRSYCVRNYGGGIMILYEKETKCYSIVVIGEDDGNWFPVDSWIFSKSDFVLCYSEALSVFNNNFKEE